MTPAQELARKGFGDTIRVLQQGVPLHEIAEAALGYAMSLQLTAHGRPRVIGVLKAILELYETAEALDIPVDEMPFILPEALQLPAND